MRFVMRFSYWGTQWQSEVFEAVGRGDLRAAIRQQWETMIAKTSPRDGDPSKALSRRLAWVDEWEKERLARPESPTSAVESWQAQAAHWRIKAEATLGGGFPQGSFMTLYVWVGAWSKLGTVVRLESDDRADHLLDRAVTEIHRSTFYYGDDCDQREIR